MTDMLASVVDVPDASRGISFATSNKGRLLPNPVAKLPLGSVKAHGWIAHQLDLMVDGMVGRLRELSKFLEDDNGWLGTDKYGWEEQPYWFRGFYDLGILTGNRRIQEESKRWIEASLNSIEEDGYFGPIAMKYVTGENGKQVIDIWPHMVMLDALRSYWEVTGDDRVVDLATKFFRFCLNLPEDEFIPPYDNDFRNWRAFIQWPRVGDMLPHIYWLYNLIQEDWLLDLATRCHKHVEPPQEHALNAHIVHFTQRFREPGNYYAQSNNPADLSETEMWYNTHMSVWGQQPGGGFGADENIRPGKTDPKQAFETCGMTEFNKSFYILGQITGQPVYADRVEDIVFNSFPASQTPDLKGLHYLTAANQPQLDAGETHDYSNMCRMIDYSPHIYRCCQHNVAMGWPYFVEHLWMAAAGDGLAAWMYGPSEACATVGNGEQIRIVEETKYPFHTAVKMTLSMKNSTRFPLQLRVPKWCKVFSVKVNGGAVEVTPKPGSYVLIERTWQNGDVVEIAMPVEVSLTTWEKSCGSVTVDRGPLSYSLRIGEKWVKGQTGTEEWPDWEVFPTTPWNYGLVFDENNLDGSFKATERSSVADQPWTIEDAPIEIKARGKRIPNWTLIDGTVTDLQPSPIKSDEPIEDITLIPMGCARLRMCCLPVISEGPEAHEWKKVSSHEAAMELRLGAEQAAQNREHKQGVVYTE
jgi:hypothetical protein